MTYGSISYIAAERKWQIECQPHVAIRLKRVFGKINNFDHKRFLISDTLENCRELVWFMQRYPLEIKSGMVRLHRGAQDPIFGPSDYEFSELMNGFYGLLQTKWGAENHLASIVNAIECNEMPAAQPPHAMPLDAIVPRETKDVSGAQTCP